MPKIIPLPSLEILNDLLELHNDFTLSWKNRPVKYFSNVKQANAWNSKFAGKKAFKGFNGDGYYIGSIFRKKYLAHRIIWKILYNYDPSELDHIDGNILNNDISNLREVTNQINTLNQSIPKNNTSSCIGIDLIKRKNYTKYRVRIGFNGKQIIVGIFDNLEEAIKERTKAEIKYDYHKNHGRKK